MADIDVQVKDAQPINVKVAEVVNIYGDVSEGVQSVQAGDNVTVDDADPKNPIVSATVPTVVDQTLSIDGQDLTISGVGGNTVELPSGGGGGGSSIVGQTVLTEAAGEITVTGLDLNTDKFYRIEFFIPNVSDSGVNSHFFYNGNFTHADYDGGYQALVMPSTSAATYKETNRSNRMMGNSGPAHGTGMISVSTKAGYYNPLSIETTSPESTGRWNRVSAYTTSKLDENVTSLTLKFQWDAYGAYPAGSTLTVSKVV